MTNPPAGGSECLLSGEQGRAAGVPVVVEPAAALAPPVAVPVEVPHAQVAVPTAIDRAPEEHRLAFPAFGDLLGVDHVPIKEIDVHHRFVRQVCPEVIADHHAFLLFWGEVQPSLFRIHEAAPPMLHHFFCPRWHDGRGVAVNDNGTHGKLLCLGCLWVRRRRQDRFLTTRKSTPPPHLLQ